MDVLRDITKQKGFQYIELLLLSIFITWRWMFNEIEDHLDFCIKLFVWIMKTYEEFIFFVNKYLV